MPGRSGGVRSPTAALSLPYLREISLKREKRFSDGQYPFTIPAVKNLRTIAFSPDVTFIIGENGTGKSTLLEAVAVGLGLNPEGISMKCISKPLGTNR